MRGLISFFDVAYTADAAGVACVSADSWTAAAAAAEITKRVAGPAATYQPGHFYERELPLLRVLIESLTTQAAVFVIDGYVWLDANNAPGLGAHLFESVGGTVPVIGVAKTPYRNDTWSAQVLRGNSARPLFVTSAGLEQSRAADLIGGMHGKHRIPTLLHRADDLARTAAALDE